MLEAAVVIGVGGIPIYWHTPNDRTVVSLPDDRQLWDVIWEHRGNVIGVAHSHPGGGSPLPSETDITTFSAIELALGRRLEWPIVSADEMITASWCGPGKYMYTVRRVDQEPPWTVELRRISEMTGGA